MKIFFVGEDPDVDMIQKPYLHRVLAVQKEIENSYVEYNGENVTLDDLCFKPVEGKGCLVECKSDRRRSWGQNGLALV